MSSWTIIWIIVAVACGIFEAVTVALVSVWFVVGSIIAGISSLFGIPYQAQIAIFVIASLLSLIGLRGYAVSMIRKRAHEDPIYSIVNKEGLVEEDINNILGTGRVKVGGESWAAKSSDDSIIKAGEYVVVQEVKGVKAIVKLKHIEKEKEI